MTDNENENFQELAELEAAYRQVFPEAGGFDYFSYGPSNLIKILREANGREIVFSYPGQDKGVLDGAVYRYKDAPAVELPNPVTLQELLYSRHPALKNSRVKIVRHRDTKQDLHTLYRNQPEDFLDYQRQQGKKNGGKGVFDACDYIVSLLGEESSRARFIGVYQVQGIAYETDEHFYYNLTEVDGYDALKERVVIKWNGAPISWQQWFGPKAPVKVVEIQNKPFGRPFTGYLDFMLTFAELRELIKTQEPRDEWLRMLSAVSGVYLILDTSTGHHYIGSAYGKGGVWGRWAQYVATNGHGSNVGLQALTDIDPAHAQHFQFTLLMTLNRTTASEEVLHWESVFKKKINPKLCHN